MGTTTLTCGNATNSLLRVPPFRDGRGLILERPRDDLGTASREEGPPRGGQSSWQGTTVPGARDGATIGPMISAKGGDAPRTELRSTERKTASRGAPHHQLRSELALYGAS